MSADQPADQPPEESPGSQAPFGATPRRKPPIIDLTATEVEAAPVVAHAPSQGATPDAPQEPTPEPTQERAQEFGQESTQESTPEPTQEAVQASPAESAPESQRPPPDEPPAGQPPPHRPARSAGALLGAGVVGGLLGAAAIWMAGLYSGREGDTSAIDAKLAALELQVRELAAQPHAGGSDARALDDLANRVAKLEATSTNAPPAADASVSNRVVTLEGELKAIARRNDEVAAAAAGAGKRADAAAAALADLTQKVARVAQPGVQKSDLDALASRVATVELGEKAMEAALARRPPADDRAARSAIAATALKSAIERGDAFAPELATVKALGADPKAMAVLEPFASAGLPKAAALARELSDLRPVLLQAAGAPPRDGGFLERLQMNAENLVRIRPVAEVAGSDPAAIIARAEVKAARADFAGAVAELATLPEGPRMAAAPWIKQAQMRLAALAAAAQLTSDALTGLSTGSGK
jgi:hypothetical protein